MKRPMGTSNGDRVLTKYTRQQALNEGLLIDVSATAQEAGIVFPVAVAQEVWGQYIKPSERAAKIGQSEQGRLWDILWMLRVAIGRAGHTDRIHFEVLVQDGPGSRFRHKAKLQALCHGGDQREPVITIKLADR